MTRRMLITFASGWTLTDGTSGVTVEYYKPGQPSAEAKKRGHKIVDASMMGTTIAELFGNNAIPGIYDVDFDFKEVTRNGKSKEEVVPVAFHPVAGLDLFAALSATEKKAA